MSSVVFNSNMKQVVSGSLDGSIMLWNFRPQLRAYKFAGHKDAVSCGSFSGNGVCVCVSVRACVYEYERE